MKVDLVLVTYNPDVSLLETVIKSISSQVRNVFIVDNSSVGFPNELFNSDNVEVISLNENMGIAYAQNVGIKESMARDSDYILLSDQDTVYPDYFVEHMMKDVDSDFAVISPLFSDLHQSKPNQGFVRKGIIGFKNFYPESGIHRVFQSIASGSILNVKHLSNIGLMKEELFIDWVDIEWCWRATSMGYKVLGNANVVISHQLGDDAVNIGFRDVNIRSSIRHYFITRNAFYLSLRCKYLGFPHRFVLFLKSFRYLVGFPLLSKPFFAHLKSTFRGFWHGLTGRLGKY